MGGISVFELLASAHRRRGKKLNSETKHFAPLFAELKYAENSLIMYHWVCVCEIMSGGGRVSGEKFHCLKINF